MSFGFGASRRARRKSGLAAVANAVWRIASIRGGETGFGAQATASAAVQKNTARQKDKLGAGNYQKLKYFDSAFQVTTTNVETAIATAITYKRSLEIGAQSQPVLWSGVASVAIASGAAAVASDEILPATFGLGQFAPSTDIWHRGSTEAFFINPTYGTVKQMLATGVGTPAGEAAYRSANTVNNETGTGDLPATGTATAQTSLAPQFFIGLATNHGPTVLVCGDSRFEGFGGDLGAGTAVAGGPARMGLEAAGICHAMHPRSSTQLTELVSASFTNYQKRKEVIPYVSDIVTNYGTNDLNNARTSAQLIADLQAYVAFAKALNPTVRIHACTIAPRTDFAAGVAGAPKPTFANTDVGGRKDFNAALKANYAAWGLTSVLLISEAVEDTANTDRWASSNYTTDGTHSTQAGQLLEKVVVQAWAAALAAPM